MLKRVSPSLINSSWETADLKQPPFYCFSLLLWQLWWWRRLLGVPWTARRSNQSIVKETSPGCSLEGLMLKLKLQYFGHLMQRADFWKGPWCWERLRAGGEGDDRGWDGWMVSLTRWTWVCVGSGSWWWTGRPGMLQSMGLQRVGHDWVTELNWTDGNLPLTRWLNQRFVVSQFWRLKVQSQRVGRVDSLAGYREGPALGLSLWLVDGYLHVLVIFFL